MITTSPTNPAMQGEQLDGDALAGYQRDGFVCARGLLAPDEVEEIRRAFMEMAANGPVPGLSEIKRLDRPYDPGDPLAVYPRMMHPHRHPDKPVGPVAMRYMLDARIGRALRQLFGEEPIAAQSMFYFKPPGARGQDFHQDNFYLRVAPGTCMAAWIAIDSADQENGGMMVTPRTHTMDVVCPEHVKDSTQFFTTEHVELPPGTQAVQTNLRAGDVLFFNGSLIHGSYPNTSKDRFRRALICHYVPRSCIEVAAGYRPLLDFTGHQVGRALAEGGGPCGSIDGAVGLH